MATIKEARRPWGMYSVYALLTLAIIAPWLKPGYILTLDMVFTPRMRMPDAVSSSYVFHVFLYVLNMIISSQIIEKIILFLIFFLAGIGMHRLVRFLGRSRGDIFQKIGAYFGGILYAVNPFTYDRLMAGQYSVLLGYALLPFFVRSLLLFLQKPDVRQSLRLAAWAIIISIVSVHTLGLMLVFAVVASALALYKNRDTKTYAKHFLRSGLLAGAVLLIATSYWLVPLAVGKGSMAREIASFSASDNVAFATTGGSALGKVANVIRLQGFWLEDRGMYILPQEQVALWGLLGLLLWTIIGTGVAGCWRSGRRFIVVCFGGVTLLGVVLAAGVFNGFLTSLPLFAGYREPQKFAGLVALGFSIFGAFGAAAAIRYSRREIGKVSGIITAIMVLLVPLIFAATIFWGCRGQLAASSYPAGWSAANQLLDRDQDNFQTLFLPWHLYMYFDFAGRIIANPAPEFFDKPVIVSDDPEFAGAKATNPTVTQKQLDDIVPGAPDAHDFGAKLAKLNIKYVLLAHDNDYQKYAYLAHETDLKLISKSATLDMYRNEAYGRK